MPMNRRTALRSLAGAGAGLALGSLGVSDLRAASGDGDGDRSADSLRPAGPRAHAGRRGGPEARSGQRAGPQVLEPFRIDFGPELVDDLHRRIDATRWPRMPFDTGWSAGTSDGVLRELVEYWRNDYDWLAVQDELNQLDHRRTPVDGEALHCVLHRSGMERRGGGAGAGVDAASFPLLLLHGWPGSFHEFSAAAERLRDGGAGSGGAGGDRLDGRAGGGRNDGGAGGDRGGAGSFDLVIPSLPGFVFSEAPRERGMHPGLIAERLHLLMGRLGYDRYGVQGGDWGAIIGTQLALRHPEAVVGLHLNFASSGSPPPDGVEPGPEERAYRARRARFQDQETGYSAIQGTRPQTLAFAQQDSPVGWLAWMLEKYWAWSDHGDDLWDTFRRDDILTTAMLYWLPGRILSAARIYYETRNAPPGSFLRERVEVPTGYARFPAEPWSPPREVVERSYNLVHYSEPPRGGHFPALEQPGLWSEDVAEFFTSL